MIRKFIMRGVSFLLVMICAAPAVLHALPFNDDMVTIQPRTGLVMRRQPAGSIALGSLSESVPDKAAAKSLQNPLKDNRLSAQNGARLFRANCFPCHGNIEDRNHAGSGPVGPFMPGPALGLAERYTKDLTDGDFFGTIHFGGAIMPALGWKLSTAEHWDIVNYIRKVQADLASQKQG